MDDSLKVDAQRIQQIEEQLINMRKQLFQAKDQVLDQLTETFSKKLKDLTKTYMNDNLMKAKLSEIKSDAQVEQVLNNNIKIVKEVQVAQKKLIIVQALSNGEFYILDEAKLGQGALTYLKSFLPSAIIISDSNNSSQANSV